MANIVKRGSKGEKKEVTYKYGNTNANIWHNGISVLSSCVRKQTGEENKTYYDAVIKINLLDENNKFLKTEDEEGNITYANMTINLSAAELCSLRWLINNIMKAKPKIVGGEINHVSDDEEGVGRYFSFNRTDEGYFLTICSVEKHEIVDQYDFEFVTTRNISVLKDGEDDYSEIAINIDLEMFLMDIESLYAAIRGPVINISEINGGGFSRKTGGAIINRPSRDTLRSTVTNVNEDDDEEDEDEKPAKKKVSKKSSSSDEEEVKPTKKKVSKKPKASKLADLLTDDEDE